jgi:hypothetical protein
MRRLRSMVLLVGVLILAGTSPAMGQYGGFNLKSMRLGPVLGFGNLGSAGMSFGGRFEKGIKELPNLGKGLLAIEASFDYYSWNSGAGNAYSASAIPFSATVNYHVNTKSDKWGVFVGTGLGYMRWSYSGCGTICGANSGVYFVGRIGGSYSIANTLQVYTDIGAGAATLNGGVMFLFGRK